MSVEQVRVTGRQFVDLIHAKAWELLGMTGQEFVDAWYRGAFEGDGRPVVRALDTMMRTGYWSGPPSPV